MKKYFYYCNLTRLQLLKLKKMQLLVFLEWYFSFNIIKYAKSIKNEIGIVTYKTSYFLHFRKYLIKKKTYSRTNYKKG